MPVDRMWKAARIQRKVGPNYALTCCGSAQAVGKKLRVPARAGEAVEPPLRPPLLHRRKTLSHSGGTATRPLYGADPAELPVRRQAHTATAGLSEPQGARFLLVKVGSDWRIDSGYTLH
jgi:hypothetical protein